MKNFNKVIELVPGVEKYLEIFEPMKMIEECGGFSIPNELLTIILSGCFTCKRIIGGPPIVMLSNEIVDTFDNDELKAIIYHELGHIEYKHLDIKTAEGVIQNVKKELEADAFSVRCGNEPDTLLTAIERLTFEAAKKALQIRAEEAGNIWTKESEDKIHLEIARDPIASARRNGLLKLRLN